MQSLKSKDFQALTRFVNEIDLKSQHYIGNNPPVDISSYYKWRKVQSVITRPKSDAEELKQAEITKHGEGFKLYLYGNSNKKRARFSKAHELGHTFFYDLSENTVRQFDCPPKWEERICNSIASALLIPKKLFQDTLKKKTFLSDFYSQLVNLDYLANRFEVSTEVMARRVLFLSERNLALFGLRKSSKNAYQGTQTKTKKKKANRNWRYHWHGVRENIEDQFYFPRWNKNKDYLYPSAELPFLSELGTIKKRKIYLLNKNTGYIPGDIWDELISSSISFNQIPVLVTPQRLSNTHPDQNPLFGKMNMADEILLALPLDDKECKRIREANR